MKQARRNRRHVSLIGFSGLLFSVLAAWSCASSEPGPEPAAEDSTEISLGQPTAVASPGFGFITGVRELDSGNVLVSDGLGGIVVRLDMQGGRVDTIGQRGSGPGEYRQPGGLLAYPGDSTLLVDYGNGRLTLIGPMGEFGRSMPMVRQQQSGEPLLLLARAVDSDGRLYIQPEYRGSRGQSQPDSAPVLRWDPRDQTADTLAMVKAVELRRGTVSMPGMSGGTGLFQVSLSPLDAWAVREDGAVAVARSDGYYIEWIDDGSVVRGPGIEFDPVPVGEAEKEQWVEWFERTGLHIGSGGDHSISVSMPGVGGHGEPDLDMFVWAERMPPFRKDGVYMDREGAVWVERGGRAADRRQFDVFDGSGALVRSVSIARDRRLGGFGRSSVYMIFTDPLDREYLEAYRIPGS